MTQAQAEQLKYRRMWTEVPGYRSTSPGEKLVSHFLRLSQWQPGDTLIDVGCGPGRASVALSEAGLAVTQLDITAASRDPGCRGLPFIEACLWEPAIEDEWDWVYCCDVLEHIPPDHVEASLDNLAKMTGFGAFMQIALFPEAFGRHIGEVLHLTVESDEWWKAKILERWNCNKFDVIDSRLICLTEGRR